MVQHHNFPSCPTLLQLLLQPVALCQQVWQFTVAVEQEELSRTIADGKHLIVTNHRVEEIREHQREAALQSHDNSLQIVVIACDVENRNMLTNAVDITESLIPTLDVRTIYQVASAYQEFA